MLAAQGPWRQEPGSPNDARPLPHITPARLLCQMGGLQTALGSHGRHGQIRGVLDLFPPISGDKN